MSTSRATIEKQIDRSMPDIIEALRLKIYMYNREIDTARAYGGAGNGNRLHIVNCRLERDKAEQLLSKLERAYT